MNKKNPHQIIKNRYVTEKSHMLQTLKDSNKNPCIAKFKNPKYVFDVDPKANKREIKEALEEIHKDLNIKVVSVNTINVKSKPTRLLRTRGGRGRKPSFKKAIVTLDPQDNLDNI